MHEKIGMFTPALWIKQWPCSLHLRVRHLTILCICLGFFQFALILRFPYSDRISIRDDKDNMPKWLHKITPDFSRERFEN